jgi:hypothetical protein
MNRVTRLGDFLAVTDVMIFFHFRRKFDEKNAFLTQTNGNFAEKSDHNNVF